MDSPPLGNFIRDYISLNEGTEIPDIFALWCGIFGISAALGRRVWLDMGHFVYFPNNYIVLVAGSGKYRKSTAIGQIENLLRDSELKLNFISQKLTPEALIDSLKTLTAENATTLKESCQGIVIVDELATFLNKNVYEAGMPALLIGLWDCKKTFEYKTKSQGTTTISDGCLGILGGSTIDWIRAAIPPDAVGSGLTSRILFVYIDKVSSPVPFPTLDSRKKTLKESLIRTLQRISTLQGPMTLSPDAKDFCAKDYMAFYQSPWFDDPYLSGYCSRRQAHLLKLSMAFCASEGGGMLIELRHIMAAQSLLKQTEARLPMVMDLITATEQGKSSDLVLKVIRRNRKISRPELLHQVSNRLSSRELTEVIDTLLSSGCIRANAESSGIYYTFIRDKSVEDER